MASIVTVQCPPNCADADCWSLRQGTWQCTFPITDTTRVGIGYLVEPSPFVRGWVQPDDFALHDHNYYRPQVPQEARSQFTFQFSESVEIGQLWLVQHQNGILQVDGYAGDDFHNLRKFGTASSLLGDAYPPTPNLFRDGAYDLFRFSAVGHGRILKIVITKTSLGDGWALYRAYPRDHAGNEYHVVSPPVPPLSPAP